MNIQVIDYDPDWASQFITLSEKLVEIVRNEFITIEHVGSTSVVGLSAKPIIDLDIVVKKENVSTVIQKLEENGYKHRGDLGIHNREAFHNPPESEINHHLYVCVEGSLALRNHLFLRDYLRKNTDKMAAYGRLKKKLSINHPDNIDSYIAGKTQFILEILESSNIDNSELEIIREANNNPA